MELKSIQGVCGILAPAVAFTSIISSILLHPWFSFPHNALSDLGAVGTPYNAIFNLGLVITGVLSLIFMPGLRTLLHGAVGKIGGVVLSAGLLSLILIGVFPEGTFPHWYVSVGFFVFSATGITLIGTDQALTRAARPWGVLVLSLVALALVSVSLIWTIDGIKPAIPETIGAFVFSEFSLIFAARLLLSARSYSARSSGL